MDFARSAGAADYLGRLQAFTKAARTDVAALDAGFQLAPYLPSRQS
jgi:hypothetical protein